MKIGLGIVATAIVVAAGSLVAMRLLAPIVPTGPPPEQGYVNVQVINGLTKRNITLTDLLQMNLITGASMFEDSGHNWEGHAVYQGVRLSTIVATVGTMTGFKAVRVNATDGYTQLYSYDNLYPNATLQNIQGDLILAFACNGTRPPTWTVGPRIVFLPPDGNYSNTDASSTTPSGWYGGSGGSRWIHNVSTIEIIPNIIVSDGSTKLDLTLHQLILMNHISGNSQFQDATGGWNWYGTYVGVSLSAIIETVGTMGVDDVVRMNSTDGYTQLYSYDNLYPNSTFYNLQGYLILAYSYNGLVAPSWDRGLRIAFLPPDEAYSNDDANKTTPSAWFVDGSAGNRWLKFVATIELLHDALPPSSPEPSLAQSQNGNSYRSSHAPLSNFDSSIAAGIEPWLLSLASGFHSPVRIDTPTFQWREDD